MVKYGTFLGLTLFSSVCFAQNKLNERGQPYGHWKFDKATYGYAEEGDYKIMSLQQYDSVHFEQDQNSNIGRLDVQYKQSKAAVTTYNYDADSFSVKDGTWNTYDSLTGKLAVSAVYINGILLGKKEYDRGNLFKYTYTNYDADSTIYLTYLNGHVFKKEFYPPGKGTNKVIQYYPDDALHFSNAEPDYNINFLSRPGAYRTSKITADADVTVTSIAASPNIKVVNSKSKEIGLPLKLRKGETYALTIQYMPRSATYTFYDTITIATIDTRFTYKIICQGWSAHIDRNNVSTVQNINLSIANDRYLFVRGCGTTTSFSITDDDGKVSNYAAYGGKITAVSLKEFAPGTYTLDVTMNDCDTEGSGINLKLSE